MRRASIFKRILTSEYDRQIAFLVFQYTGCNKTVILRQKNTLIVAVNKRIIAPSFLMNCTNLIHFKI